MADELSWITDLGKQTAGGLYELLIWVVLGAILIGAVWFLLWWLSYKHEVTIRYITKSRKYIIKDKAKTVRKDGAQLWRLLRMRSTVKPPPPEAIEITKKGKFFAECYWSEENPSPTWLQDSGDETDAFSHQAFTSDERSFYVAQLKKAIVRQKGSLFDKIMQFAMPIAMIILVAIPFVFFGNLTEESTKQAASNVELARINEKIAAENARILTVLAGKVEAGDLVIKQDIKPPDAPPDGGGE